MLYVENLTFRYGVTGRNVLRGATFQLQQGTHDGVMLH